MCTPRYFMEWDLTIKSPTTFRSSMMHFLSCGLFPKYMNSVLAGYILSLTASIQGLMLSMHVCRLCMVVSSWTFDPALKLLLMLWSSAKPLRDKSDGKNSCSVKQYKLKMLTPTQEPYFLVVGLAIFIVNDHFEGSWSKVVVKPFESLPSDSILSFKYIK